MDGRLKNMKILRAVEVQETIRDKLAVNQTIRLQICGCRMGQYMEHAHSWLIEFARLTGEGETDGPDGRLQLKILACLFIILL